MAVPDPESRLTPVLARRRIERYIAWSLAGSVVLGTIFRYAGRVHWIFELTTHFVVQSTILAAVASVVLLVRRFRRLASVTCVLTVLNATEWVFYYRPASLITHAVVEDQRLTVASVNVFSRNRRVQDVERWLKESRADVVFLSEVDPWWATQIARWADEWPHQIVHPRADHFGLALISRYPLSDSEILHLDGFDPAVRARVTHQQQAWSIVGLHPFPPVGKLYASLRNDQLSSAARQIEKLPKPRILLGDLNMSSSSPYFRDFVRSTGLVDSRVGFGWQPTWPAGNVLLRIPIDHCLVDPGVEVLERSVGAEIGSDHLPIKIVLKVEHTNDTSADRAE